MARIFLDTNVFIDIVEKRKDLHLEDFQGHTLIISPLSVHILLYITKNTISPSDRKEIGESFEFVSFDVQICLDALEGPMRDFEDNVQLQSARSINCEYFLTRDKELLTLKNYGETKIVTTVS